ncbi:MAG: histidine phosphatase family protein [Longimicrobiales bacterium]
MKRLILFRHAKSSWDDPDLDDHARPLAPRGNRAAPAMAHWFAETKQLPARVLCSDAVRTRQTWDRVAEVWDSLAGPLPDVGFHPGLYLASPRRILGLVAQDAGDADTVMVVGHNPGMHDLARTLAVPGSTKAHRRLAAKFPTAAAAVLEFDVDRWDELDAGQGRLAAFMRPKDLPDARERRL